MPPHPTNDGAQVTGREGTAHQRDRRQRGQVMVIFAGSMLALMAMCAVVVDVAWYWTVNLRMQRAADAAALAGVVWLPNKAGTAATVAIAEATKNGFQDGVGGIEVYPEQDPNNSRRLKVRIEGPVGTFFARAIGISEWPAVRSAKADYVLPVPMGSPQNYYGVGFYEGRVATTTTTYEPGNEDSGIQHATDWPQDDDWVESSGTLVSAVESDNSAYAGADRDGDTQRWTRFNLLSNLDANERITDVTGIRVTLGDVRMSGTGCGGTTNRVDVQLSWDGGFTWTDATSDTRTPSFTSTTQADYQIPPAPPTTPTTAIWTASGLDWDDDATSKLSNANFVVRLAADKGCTTRDIRVDELSVRVYYAVEREITTTTWSTETLDVPDPLTTDPLASQGFWGAIFTSGGWRENGDKFAPAVIGNGTSLSSTSASPTYDAAGYDYTIELPGGSGQVQLFDPMFCATGDNGHGGWFGAGDHWTSPGNIAPVSITYRLYDTKETLLDATDDGDPVATLTYDPGNATMGDLSGAFGTPQNSAHGARQDCSTNAAHSQWVTMASGLGSATYRLNVNTTLAAANRNVGAENLFSIWVKSGGAARVYGGGRMAAYTNLDTGQQKFYFAQVERVHAGKKMLIHLFDPGETNGNAYLRLLSPDGDSYDYQRFDWKSDDGRSGTNVDVIQTSNGSALFNNREITITVDLPDTYGDSGLDPPGDITDEDGWWLIEYQLTNGNDTTTWSVDIIGNPVHLVLP